MNNIDLDTITNKHPHYGKPAILLLKDEKNKKFNFRVEPLTQDHTSDKFTQYAYNKMVNQNLGKKVNSGAELIAFEIMNKNLFEYQYNNGESMPQIVFKVLKDEPIDVARKKCLKFRADLGKALMAVGWTKLNS